MKKICIILDKKTHKERFNEISSMLTDFKDHIKYDDCWNKESPVTDYNLIIAHKTDVMGDDWDTFHNTIKKNKTHLLLFSGDFENKVEYIREAEYQINYEVLKKGITDFIKTHLKNKSIDISTFKKVKLTKLEKEEVQKSFLEHKKLETKYYTQIIEHIKTITNKTILFADDDISNRYVSSVGNISIYNTIEESIDIIKKKHFDIAILDIEFEREKKSGFDILKTIKSKSPGTKVIMLSGYDNFDIAYKSFIEGADHFISKQNFSMEYFKSMITLIDVKDAPLIIGKDDKTLEMFKYISFYSKFNEDVLIRGENGSGKELVAKSIYNLGEHHGKYITKNCAGIPDTLFESEMFGYVKGSFTGALKDGKKSLFEDADNGVLFLDEIGDLPPNQQVKLLRVIQEKEVMPVGSTIAKKYNTRLLYATNKNLEKEIEGENFRIDFYYRITGAVINIPSLRERPEDIQMLTAFFCNKFHQRNKRFAEKLITIKLDEKSFEKLIRYSFPGNIRELEKIVNQSLLKMIIDNKKVLSFVMPNDSTKKSKEYVTNYVSVEEIVNLLEKGVINSKGIENDIKKKVLQHLKNQNKKNKEIAKIMGINEQSVRNIRSKFEI